MNNQVLTNYLSTEELAKQMGLTSRTLFRWNQLRVGPPVTRIGKKNFYKVSSVQEWLEKQEGLPPR